MKNYILLFISAFIISLFWYSIYAFAGHSAAAYLAIIFGAISISVLTWVVFSMFVVIKAQSKQELQKVTKAKLAQEKMVA